MLHGIIAEKFKCKEAQNEYTRLRRQSNYCISDKSHSNSKAVDNDKRHQYFHLSSRTGMTEKSEL
jgi:hypothetical protein